MALAWFVDSPDRIAHVFAAHDEYLAVFSYFLNGKERPSRALNPNDDFFTAPFAFMPKENRRNGFLVFTMQVPWLDGTWLKGNHPTDPHQEESAHFRAWQWMENREEAREAPIVGTAEEFQRKLNLREHNMFTFTGDGCYPSKDDISQALEDKAVEVTCKAMGWKIPQSWRLNRKKADTHNVPMLDLAEWDRRHNRTNNNGSNDGSNSNSAPIPPGDDNSREEEKKESAEYQC